MSIRCYRKICAICVKKKMLNYLAVPKYMLTFASVNPYCITLNLYAYETECDCISCKISPNAWPFRKLFVLLPLSRCDRRRSFQSSDELREDGKMGKFINPFTDMGFKRIFGQEVSKPPAERRAPDKGPEVPGQGTDTDIGRGPLADLRHLLRAGER